MLEVKNVSKSFVNSIGKRQAFITDLSFSVQKGECAVFVGPNGSGKTTVMKMIASLLVRDAGEITLCGKDIAERENKMRMGYLAEVPQFPPFLTAEEFLHVIGDLYALDRETAASNIQVVLDTVGLYAHRTEKIGGYSKGMLKRLGLAQAVIAEPSLVVLDEALDGLDPVGIHMFRSIMAQCKKQQQTVLLTTHLLSEVEHYADRIFFIKNGAIVYENTLSNINDKSSLEETYLTLMQECVEDVHGNSF